MKLKLDENLPHDLAAALATRGHDVHTVIDEHLAGQTDPVVVRAAAAEDRMVLTLDRGVGDLRHYPPGSHAGVVLRPASQDPATIQHLVERLLQAQPLDRLRGCVAIVEPERIRVRRPDQAGPA